MAQVKWNPSILDSFPILVPHTQELLVIQALILSILIVTVVITGWGLMIIFNTLVEKMINILGKIGSIRIWQGMNLILHLLLITSSLDYSSPTSQSHTIYVNSSNTTLLAFFGIVVIMICLWNEILCIRQSYQWFRDFRALEYRPRPERQLSPSITRCTTQLLVHLLHKQIIHRWQEWKKANIQ